MVYCEKPRVMFLQMWRKYTITAELVSQLLKCRIIIMVVFLYVNKNREKRLLIDSKHIWYVHQCALQNTTESKLFLFPPVEHLSQSE